MEWLGGRRDYCLTFLRERRHVAGPAGRLLADTARRYDRLFEHLFRAVGGACDGDCACGKGQQRTGETRGLGCEQELPGDIHMPRVQGVDFGASERFGIMPGHEDQSYFHMPGGQSDHPLSPYYGAGHENWASGRAAPLLPGPPEHRLTLTPSGVERR